MNEHIIYLRTAGKIAISDTNHNDEYAALEVIKAKIKIAALLENGYDELQNAGFLELHYYNVIFAKRYALSIFDTFDRSADTYQLGGKLFKYRSNTLKRKIIKQFGEGIGENILVIRDMGLYPEFRGKGYGHAILKGLIEQYEGKCSYLFLHSLPKQQWGIELSAKEEKLKLELFEQDPEISQAKLNKFFESCGLEPLNEYNNFFGHKVFEGL